MSESLASWVPVPVLVGVVLAATAALWRKFDGLLEKILLRLDTLERSLHTFATVEQLGRLGDRQDERISQLRERTGKLEAIPGLVADLESRHLEMRKRTHDLRDDIHQLALRVASMEAKA